jgi:hypothetical protein
MPYMIDVIGDLRKDLLDLRLRMESVEGLLRLEGAFRVIESINDRLDLLEERCPEPVYVVAPGFHGES